MRISDWSSDVCSSDLVIFDGGQRAAQVRSQRAAAEGAFANYKQTVLIALEDVENALSALQAAQQRNGQFTIALDAAHKRAILVWSQYQAGLNDDRQSGA